MPIEYLSAQGEDDEFTIAYNKLLSHSTNPNQFPTGYSKSTEYAGDSLLPAFLRDLSNWMHLPAPTVWVVPELDEDFKRITVKARFRAHNAIVPRNGGRLFIGRANVSIHSKTITVHAISNKDACISGLIFFKETFFGKGMKLSNTTEKYRLDPYTMKVECLSPSTAKKLHNFLPTHPTCKSSIRGVDIDEEQGVVFIRGIKATYKEMTDVFRSFQVTLHTSNK